jgi:hypothetical protein
MELGAVVCTKSVEYMVGTARQLRRNGADGALAKWHRAGPPVEAVKSFRRLKDCLRLWRATWSAHHSAQSAVEEQPQSV